MPQSDDRDGGNGGHRAAESLRRIGSVFAAPQSNFEGRGGSGPSLGFGDLLGFVSGASGQPTAPETTPDEPKKLPPRAGGAADAAWQSLAPIAARDPEDCPRFEDLGVVLFVHDVEDKRRDFAERSDADRWQAVHNISDLIEGLRALVGKCGKVRGIMISSHGGFSGHGGFRMGDDDDGDDEIDGSEANDMVSTAEQAQAFGTIVKEALAADGFISVEACSSAGPDNAFLKALHDATGATVIGAPGTANVGGNWWSGAWWTASSGRTQVAADGSASTDSDTSGEGVWRPF